MTKQIQKLTHLLEVLRFRSGQLCFQYATTRCLLPTVENDAKNCNMIKQTQEDIFNKIEWYVFSEMRTGAGNRDSMPRDYYSSGGGGSGNGFAFIIAIVVIGFVIYGIANLVQRLF